MTNKIVRFLLKQHNTGVWYGVVLSLTATAMSFLAPMGYIVGMGTFYGVWRKEIMVIFPWLSAFWIVVLAVMGAALIMLLGWKFIIPARVRYGNWQGAKHGNKIIEEINKSEKRMKLIFAGKEDIKRMEKKLDQLLREKIKGGKKSVPQ